jgi:hypothetical protein
LPVIAGRFSLLGEGRSLALEYGGSSQKPQQNLARLLIHKSCLHHNSQLFHHFQTNNLSYFEIPPYYAPNS